MRNNVRVCVLGGTGFIGQSVVRRLVQAGCEVQVLTRRREKYRDLLVLPHVELVESDIFSDGQLQKNFAGMDVVINLVGILVEQDRKTRNFQAAHVGLTRKVIDACRNTGITRLIHMSALQSNANRGPSKYLRSKGEAENMVHTTAGFNVTTFRPSVVFGPDDQFLNRFASILRSIPSFMPLLLACPNARFAPIYVEDLASVIVSSIDFKLTFGERYNMCGPKEYRLQDIVAYIGTLLGQKRRIIGLGSGLSKLQAAILGNLPGTLLTRDNVASMQVDSVCDGAFPEIFDITPQSMESIAPRYLANEHTRGCFDAFRRQAGRDPVKK
ncbi:MAG: complex I NDUFA9 subunit family protein [Thiohalomonadales bacterium]